MDKKKHEILRYLICGILTTAVNWALYILFSRILLIDYLTSTAFAWVGAVLFAYLANKCFVFRVYGFTLLQVRSELTIFIAARMLTFGLDMVIMWAGVTLFKQNDLVVKILSNIVITILNYTVSKKVIFKNK